MFIDYKIEVFLAVAREESFTRAARRLGVSQPAVSQSIAELESELGRKLFERSPQSVSLTAEGTAFLRFAERLHRLGDDTARLFAPAPSGESTRLTVMAPPVLQERWLPERIAPVLDVRKSLQIVLIDSALGNMGDADLSFRLCPPGDTLDLEHPGECLLTELTPLLLVSARNVASLQAVSLEDLPDAPLAIWEGYADRLPDRLRARICLTAPSAEAVHAAVAQSPVMLGLVPDTAAPLPETLRRISLAGLPPLPLDLRCRVSDAFSRTTLWELLKRTLSL